MGKTHGESLTVRAIAGLAEADSIVEAMERGRKVRRDPELKAQFRIVRGHLHEASAMVCREGFREDTLTDLEPRCSYCYLAKLAREWFSLKPWMSKPSPSFIVARFTPSKAG